MWHVTHVKTIEFVSGAFSRDTSSMSTAKAGVSGVPMLLVEVSGLPGTRVTISAVHSVSSSLIASVAASGASRPFYYGSTMAYSAPSLLVSTEAAFTPS